MTGKPKRRTSADRHYDRMASLRSRLRDIYGAARSYKSSSDVIVAQLSARIWRAPEYAKLPLSYREYLRGYADALADALWQEMSWRLGTADKPLTREAGETWTDELSGLCRIPGALYGGHFWRGTDRPYTPYECINLPSPETAAPVWQHGTWNTPDRAPANILSPDVLDLQLPILPGATD